MFNDMYAIMRSLEHDTEEQNGERVHPVTCRRCTLHRALGTFRIQLRAMVMNIDEAVRNEEPRVR